MGKIGCRCGASIPDSIDFNPSKARFVRDVDFEATEDELITRFAGYLRAVLDGTSREWLLQAGYSPDYVARGVPHEDAIGNLLSRNQPELFECYNCGRLLIETSPDRFDYYLPEDGKPLGPFRKAD